MSDFEKLLKQAQAGDVTAMYNLAFAYRDGEGTTPDIDQFFAWIKKAADTGDADSMHLLA